MNKCIKDLTPQELETVIKEAYDNALQYKKIKEEKHREEFFKSWVEDQLEHNSI